MHAPIKQRLAHPFFQAVLPGGAGLTAGIVLASWTSLMGSRLTYAFEPLPGTAQEEMALDLVAWINIALPWAGLFAGILVGSLLMIPYRRALKRHKALIIESWFMPPRRFLSLQTRDPQFLSWRVSWPLQVLSLPIFLAFFIGGFHGGMIIISGGCGAYGMLLFTYCERRDIYEEIAKKWRQTVGASSGKEWDGSLGRSAKFLVAGMVLCFVGILISVSVVLHGIAFSAQKITDSRRTLSETIRDLSVKQVEAGTDSTVAVNPPLESITTE